MLRMPCSPPCRFDLGPPSGAPSSPSPSSPPSCSHAPRSRPDPLGADAAHPGFALRDETARPAFTSSTTARPSIRRSPASSRTSPRSARRCPSPTSTATASPISTSRTAASASRTRSTTTAATARSRTSRASAGVADLNRAGRRRVDGRHLGRHRQRRPRGPARLPLRLSRAVQERRRPPLRGHHRKGRPAPLGEQQRRHLDRLRSRWPARPLRHRLLPRHRSLAPDDDADHAQQLRVRRPTAERICSSTTSATASSRTSPTRWASAARAGRSPPRRPTSTATAGPTSISPTTTGPRSCTSTTTASGSCSRTAGLESESKSGMAVALGDAFNRGQPRRLRHEHLRARLHLPEQQPAPQRDDRGATASATSPRAQIADAGWAWGAQFGDLNNDGANELFVANGFISADRDEELLVRDVEDRRRQRRVCSRTRRRGPRSAMRASPDTSGRASTSTAASPAGWTSRRQVGANGSVRRPRRRDGRSLEPRRGGRDRREPESAGRPLSRHPRQHQPLDRRSSSSARAAIAARSAPRWCSSRAI